MRAALLALAAVLGGCQLLLGIEDPVGDECSPFDIDSCDITDTCDVRPEDGRLTCRMEGTVQAGELCFEIDDCAGPLSCSDGVCRTFCPVFGQDCPDPAEGSCVRNWGISGQICDSSCTPHDNGNCITGADCILSVNDNGTPISLCVPNTYYDPQPAGQACGFLENCVPGYACDENTSLCTQLCDVNAPACTTGACTARFETIHDDIQLGFCL